jgi:hypothetical protein
MTRKQRAKEKAKTIFSILAAAALLVAMALTLIPRTASFDLSVSTEYVEAVTSGSYQPVWYLSTPQFSDGLGGAPRPFLGSLKIAPNIRITLQRIGTGPLFAELTPIYEAVKSCGMMSNSGEGFSSALGPHVILKIPDVAQRSGAGQSTVLPLGGEIRLGAASELPGSQLSPLLRQGSLTVLGRNFLGSDLYKAAPQLLEPGDVVVFEKQVGSAFGLVSVDERPAMGVTLHVLAREAEIRRPPSEGYTVGLTLLDRVKNDGTLQSIWGAFIFLLALRKLGE